MKRRFRALVGVLAVLVSMNASVFLFNLPTYAKETGVNGATAPTAPTNVVASAPSSGQVNLSWTAVTAVMNGDITTGWDAASYKVYRSSDGTFSNATPVVGTPTSPSFSDTTVSPNTTYYYKVAAVAASGSEGQNSSMVSVTTPAAPVVTPNPPSNLVVTSISTNQVNLSWSAASGSVDSYRIERSTDGSNFNFYSYSNGIATTFSDMSVSAGQTYYYRVASYKSPNLVSSFTNTINASIPNPAPTPSNLVATAISDSQINLTWSWSGSGGVFYVVERSLDGSSGWTVLPSVTVTSYQDTNLAASTRYYYRVRAFTTDYGAYSNTANDRTKDKQGGIISISVQVINLTATPDCPSNIKLVWNTISGATTYTVQRSANSAVGFSTVAQNSTGSFTDTGLVSGNTYYYKVIANDSGNSTSNVVNVQLSCGNNPTSVSTGSASSTQPGGISSSYGGATSPGGGLISTGTGSSGGQPGAGSGYGGADSGNPGSLSSSYGTPSTDCLPADTMPTAEWKGVVYTNPTNPSSGIVFSVLPDKSAFNKGESVKFSYCWQNPTTKTRRIRVTRQLYDQNGRTVGSSVSVTKTLSAGQKFTLDRTRVLGTNLAPGPYKEEVSVTHLYSVNGDIPLDSNNAFWVTIGDEGNPGATSVSGSASSSDPGGLLGAAYGAPGSNPAPGAKYGTGSGGPSGGLGSAYGTGSSDSGGGLSGAYGGGSGSGPTGGLGAGYGAASNTKPGPGAVLSDFSPVPHTDPPGKPGSPGIIYEWLPGKDTFSPGGTMAFGVAFTPAMGDSREIEIIHKLIGPAGFEKDIKLDPPTPGVSKPAVDPNDPPPGGGGPGVGDPGRGTRRSVRMGLPPNLPPGTYTSLTEVRDKKTHELIDSTSFTFTVYRGSK